MVARARQPTGRSPQKATLSKSNFAQTASQRPLSTLSGLTGTGKRAALSIEGVLREVQGRTAALQESALAWQAQLQGTQTLLQTKLDKRAKADTAAAERILETAEALMKHAQAATQTSREELHAEVEAMLRAARSDLALKQLQKTHASVKQELIAM